MDAIFFRTSDELRVWFAQNPDAGEMWVGFFKKSAAEQGISYPEAVDEALCAGWIDGVRYTVDDERYRICFTPRRPRSNWSQVNIRRVEELAAQGRLVDSQRQARSYPPAPPHHPDGGFGAGHRRAWPLVHEELPPTSYGS